MNGSNAVRRGSRLLAVAAVVLAVAAPAALALSAVASDDPLSITRIRAPGNARR